MQFSAESEHLEKKLDANYNAHHIKSHYAHLHTSHELHGYNSSTKS